LRRLWNVAEQFYLAATAQNLKRFVRHLAQNQSPGLSTTWEFQEGMVLRRFKYWGSIKSTEAHSRRKTNFCRWSDFSTDSHVYGPVLDSFAINSFPDRSFQPVLSFGYFVAACKVSNDFARVDVLGRLSTTPPVW